MKLSDLEKFVILEYLRSQSIDFPLLKTGLDEVEVEGREFSRVGFITELKPECYLRIMPVGSPFVAGDVEVKINGHIDTGYVLYVRDGCLEAIEGYTYDGVLWPSEVESFHLQ